MLKFSYVNRSFAKKKYFGMVILAIGAPKYASGFFSPDVSEDDTTSLSGQSMRFT